MEVNQLPRHQGQPVRSVPAARHGHSSVYIKGRKELSDQEESLIFKENSLQVDAALAITDPAVAPGYNIDLVC